MYGSASAGEVHAHPRLAALTRMLALVILIGCTGRGRLASSSACPAQPIEDARFRVRYLPCQLTKLPVLQIDTSSWRYPDMMRSAGVSGRVRAAFIVDTGGRYVPASIRVLSSDHVIFSNAVKAQLLRARFSLGRRGRTRVPVELTHDFVFVLPSNASPLELARTPDLPTTTRRLSSHDVPAIEISLDAEDTALGPRPSAALRDSLAHVAIRMRARALGWDDDTLPHAPKPPALLLCVQGDTSVFESATDRSLAATMTRPHVRVMTMRGCPPTRDRMVALPPGMEPRYPPDSVPFVEPHRLHVARVALRRGGGPQLDLVDEQGLSEIWYRCVRVPRASSIFVLRCLTHSLVSH